VFDVVALRSPEDLSRLTQYAAGGRRHEPLPGFWTAGDVLHERA
jgi:hypothetical protein